MKHFSLPLSALLLAAPLVLGACATVSDSPLQQLELHAILDHTEVGGVGCILSNDMGRWFVVAPGRVTVTRSRQALHISCKKDGAGMARESVDARMDVAALAGNVVISAGIGHLVDRYTGAGFAYPAKLTVMMEASQPRADLVAAQKIESRVF